MTDVLVPTSAEEAATAFGDGSGITVLAGGTLVVPAIKLGRLRPARTLFLGRAGLGGIERADGTVKIGATTPIAELVDGAPEPLATFARHVADTENGVRVAILGAGARAVRAASVEQALARGAAAKDAAAKALDDVEPQDDALASAWYRRQVLPGLVERALEELR